MARPAIGTVTSFEAILLNNPNVFAHPQLAVFLEDYTAAIAAGYTPSQQVLDAILELSPISRAATSALEELKIELDGRGLISLALRIEQTTTLSVINDSFIGTTFSDLISVQTSDEFGIVVENSVFDLLGGNNTITVSGSVDGIFNNVGIFNTNSSTFSLGDGNNTISASGALDGIFNSSTFSLGDGGNTITTLGSSGFAINNDLSSTFSLGNGDNAITASGGFTGISNFDDSAFSFGNGNNTITAAGGFTGISNGNSSTFSLGDGNNTIMVSGAIVGIFNDSTFSLGNGNNTIIAEGGIGILNFGTISTGAGNDVIDALTGGFSGSSGTLRMGAGDDILKGHGAGNFFGGNGTDILIFAEGTYNIAPVDSGFEIMSISSGLTGTYNSFELIGGTSGDLLTLDAGTLVVAAGGTSYSLS